jgi:hypothetical protein
MIERIETILIYGKQIPSDDTLQLIFAELEASEKIHNFVATNNHYVEHMSRFLTFDIVDGVDSVFTSLKFWFNYEKQCELIGFCFPAVIYAITVVTWFDTIMGYSVYPNKSDAKKNISKRANTFKKTGEYIGIGEHSEYKPELNRFDQYKESSDYLGCFKSRVYELSKTNQQMKDLLIQHDEIMKNFNKNSLYDDRYRVCRFCMSVFNVKTSPNGSKSCSIKCGRAYSAATTKKSSNQPHSVNKKSKQTDSQWKKIDNIYRWCHGTCASRRLVNAHHLCKDCHDNPPIS